jgi:hypothetical protein
MTFQSIILTLWELPQIVLGRMIAKKFGKYVHTVDGANVYLTNGTRHVSMGDSLFVDENAEEGTWLVKHEFGHIIQSRILGWLYLPLIVIPSYLWYTIMLMYDELGVIKKWKATLIYHQFYTEKWANWLVA